MNSHLEFCIFSLSVPELAAWDILYVGTILFGTLILVSTPLVRDWLHKNAEAGISAGAAVGSLSFWLLAPCLLGTAGAYGMMPPMVFATVPIWYLLSKLVGMPPDAMVVGLVWYGACSFSFFAYLFSPRRLNF